ncbi:hypothetical protein K3495_g4588 [Podosphaera aphanis]|nr:hypothetical protein K3495_g4588 [Podosphaera aphanis]
MAGERVIFFFDIDNCLYPKSKNVSSLLIELIVQYMVKNLKLSHNEANELHQGYYRDYGLAVEGLSRHYKIDPLEYNRQVDDALPLESLLSPDPELRKLLLDMNKTKVKLWLFTNAYSTHGKRVVQLLGVDDLFEGITFSDYSQEKILCKPHPKMYEKAMREAGIGDPKKCYFVDDSESNCRSAEKLGWTAVLLQEDCHLNPLGRTAKPCQYQISKLEDLRDLFPWMFDGK